MQRNAPGSRTAVPQDVCIVGGGVTGLVCAYLLSGLGVSVTVLEAGSDPRFKTRQHDLSPTFGGNLGHFSVRHLTGTESLVPPAGLLNLPAWLAEKRTANGYSCADKPGLKKSSDKSKIGLDISSGPAFDATHALFNYAGLSLWESLSVQQLSRHLFGDGQIPVYHSDEVWLESDLRTEQSLQQFGGRIEMIGGEENSMVNNFHPLVDRHFDVPGRALYLRRFCVGVLDELSKRKNVQLVFDHPVSEKPQGFDQVIWATNSTLAQSEELMKGLLGFWVTIENNHGLEAPFKFVADFPLGFLNVTPDDANKIHISGGLFWVDHFGQDMKPLVEYYKEIFLSELKKCIALDDVQELTAEQVSGCLRPCGPQGLPVLKSEDGEMWIGGASKSGTVQAPLVGLWVAEKLGFDIEEVATRIWGTPENLGLVNQALNQMTAHRELVVSR